jgi:hypothetical protein
MWKIFLALVSHRFLLLAIALFTINAKISPQISGRVIRPFQSKTVLFHKFVERVGQGSEVKALTALNQAPASKVFELTQDPFLWFGRFLSLVFPDNSVLIVIIFSNLFLLLFLWELNSLASRMALPEVASGTGVLAVLWMTSYELSLGSNLSLTCYLVTLIFRSVIDNEWIFTGAGLALLAFSDRIALGLLPILIYLFWHFQRFNPAAEVLKKGCILLLPVLLAIILRWKYYQDIWLFVNGSALMNLIEGVKTGSIASWPWSQGNLGQTISWIVFLLGAITAAVVNSSLILRLLPLLIWVGVMAFSSYTALASRLLIAAICFEGIAAAVSGLFIRLIQLALIILSCYEMISLF